MHLSTVTTRVRTRIARTPSIPQIRNIQHQRPRRSPPRTPHAPYPPRSRPLFPRPTRITTMDLPNPHYHLYNRTRRVNSRIPPLALAPPRALPRPARVQAVEAVDGCGVCAGIPAPVCEGAA